MRIEGAANRITSKKNDLVLYYKVVETNCDPGEVIIIRNSLESIYKRKIEIFGELKFLYEVHTSKLYRGYGKP